MVRFKMIAVLLLIVCIIFTTIGCVEVEDDSSVAEEKTSTYKTGYELESGEDIYVDNNVEHFSIVHEQYGDYNVIKYYDPDLQSWIMIVHEEDECVAQILVFAEDGTVKATVGAQNDE